MELLPDVEKHLTLVKKSVAGLKTITAREE